MRVGIIGFGKWGRTLTRKLVEAGAEIAAHDRASEVAMPDRFGPRVPWTDMLGDETIDAVVAATPPDVTTEIFHACQAAKKPCLLTKPLLVEPGTMIATTTMVDYVHLFSPLWNDLWTLMASSKIYSMNAISTGTSSPRSFPASLDYGPHAMALILDAAGDEIRDLAVKNLSSILTRRPDGSENLWAEMEIEGIRTTLSCGNIGPRATTFFAQLDWGAVIYSENDGEATLAIDGKIIVRDRDHDPLSRMVEKFLWNVTLTSDDDYLVQLSSKISSTLTEARSRAS